MFTHGQLFCNIVLMKRIISTLCLIISITCGSFSVCWSDDFQMGMEAYKKGDFANAIKEWIFVR